MAQAVHLVPLISPCQAEEVRGRKGGLRRRGVGVHPCICNTASHELKVINPCRRVWLGNLGLRPALTTSHVTDQSSPPPRRKLQSRTGAKTFLGLPFAFLSHSLSGTESPWKHEAMSAGGTHAREKQSNVIVTSSECCSIDFPSMIQTYSSLSVPYKWLTLLNPK